MLEAELYFALNTERKKLTKVDELRAEVICQDKDALHIQNVMQELNFQTDGFGARPILDENGDEDPNEAQPIEVTNFGQFYYVVMSDYSKDVFGLRDIKRGYRYHDNKREETNFIRSIRYFIFGMFDHFNKKILFMSIKKETEINP